MCFERCKKQIRTQTFNIYPLRYITLPDKTSYTSDNLDPENILYAFRKEELLKIAKKVDSYYTPNHTKDRLSRNIVSQIESYPENLLGIISRTEYPLLIELVEETDPNKYVERPIRKTPYALMKLGFVATYEDTERQKWCMLMPNKIKNILRQDLPGFNKLFEQGLPIPKPKEVRFMYMMYQLNQMRGQATDATKEASSTTED